jgi:two-component system, NarL family, response regulator
VLVVDDHPLMREGLLAMLRTQSDMTVVAEAGSGPEAVVRFGTHQPDVVLMDLRLPGMSGVEAIKEIRKEFPEARIIMLTTYDGDEDIYQALEAGAKAYLLKETLGNELLEVIRDVRAGQRHIPPAVSARLAEYLPRAELSPRELEVLQLIAEGLRNKEIAARLGIAEPTVKIHVQKIFSKLNVIDRTQAVVTAAHRGIIHL